MPKEIPQFVLDYYQGIMDSECSVCFKAGEPSASLVRGNMFFHLEPLRKRAVEAGFDPKDVEAVFMNFEITCDNCFATGKLTPTLSNTKSCVIGMGMLGSPGDSTQK